MENDLTTKTIRVQEPRRNWKEDAVINFTAGTLVVSPVIDAAIEKAAGRSGFWEYIKGGFTTAAGWKRNLLSGAGITAITLGVYALTGGYRKEIKDVTVTVPAGTTLPGGEVIAEAIPSRKFQEKETARREHAQEQGAQIG